MREPGDYREPEERTTVVTSDRGSGTGMVAGIVLAIAAVAIVLFLFGNFGGGDVDPNPTAGIEAPDVDASAPDVDIEAPNPDVDVDVNPPADAPEAPAATDSPAAQPAPSE